MKNHEIKALIFDDNRQLYESYVLTHDKLGCENNVINLGDKNHSQKL